MNREKIIQLVFGCVFEGYGSVIVGFIGTLANSIAIIILTRYKELSAYFFNWLLTVLAIIDNIFLTCGVYEAVRQHFYQSSLMDHIYAGFLHPFRSMIMVSSIYMIVVLSYERHKAVSGTTRYQSTVNEILNPWRHLIMYVGPVIIGSILFYVPKFFELEMKSFIVEPSTNVSELKMTMEPNTGVEMSSKLAFTPLRHNKIYVLWYVTIFNAVMTSGVPFLCLVYLNVKIYFGLKKIRQRRCSLISNDQTNRARTNVSQATVLLTIVSIFVLCHVLRLILNIAEIINHENERKASNNGCLGVKYWMFIATVLSNFLVIVNSSTNLFVYCIVNKVFRDILIKTISSALVSLKEKLGISCWYCMCRSNLLLLKLRIKYKTVERNTYSFLSNYNETNLCLSLITLKVSITILLNVS